jgi:hypothetical protein
MKEKLIKSLNRKRLVSALENLGQVSKGSRASLEATLISFSYKLIIQSLNSQI